MLILQNFQLTTAFFQSVPIDGVQKDFHRQMWFTSE